MLQEHLEAAERHVAQGREHIAHQCELIAELERTDIIKRLLKLHRCSKRTWSFRGFMKRTVTAFSMLLVKIRPQPRIELGRNGIGSRQSIADLE